MQQTQRESNSPSETPKRTLYSCNFTLTICIFVTSKQSVILVTLMGSQGQGKLQSYQEEGPHTVTELPGGGSRASWLTSCNSLLAMAIGANAGSCFVSNYTVLISPAHSKESRVEEGPDQTYLFWTLTKTKLCQHVTRKPPVGSVSQTAASFKLFLA